MEERGEGLEGERGRGEGLEGEGGKRREGLVLDSENCSYE